MEDSKVTLITGASRGIGRQFAIDCARHGFTVVINYVSNDSLAQDVVHEITELGGRAVAIKADVSISSEVDRLIETTLKQFDRIDHMINNAGVGKIVSLEELDAAHFEQTLRLNLLSAFLVSQAAIPHMKSIGGRLIYMSSIAARTGGMVSAAYAASKAGIEGLMHYYATFLLPYRITANAIAPALIASDIVNEMKLPPPDELPLGRVGRPEEIWSTVRMILETEYLTGQTIHINAGRYMT